MGSALALRFWCVDHGGFGLRLTILGVLPRLDGG